MKEFRDSYYNRFIHKWRIKQSKIAMAILLIIDLIGANAYLLDIKLLERGYGTVQSVLLHLLRHVGVFNNSFTFSHFKQDELRLCFLN